MKLYIDKNEIVLDFPFDAGQVAEIKQIPGARWDKIARVWRLPITSIDMGRQFAMRHKFDVSIDAMKFTVPSSPIPRSSSRVYLHDGMLIMRFPYERVIIKAVKQIPAVSWNSKMYAWQAPISSISGVISWAQSFGVSIDNDVVDIASKVESKMSKFIEASRSVDANVEIPALTGTLLPYQRAGVAYAAQSRRSFIADEMGLGKLQAVSSPVLTPDGWLKMGDIKPGMFVIGRNGLSTKVTAVYPQGVKSLYRVTFSDGSSTLAGEEHLWTVRTANMAHGGDGWVTVTTGEMMRGETINRNNSNGRTYQLSLAVKAQNGNRRLQIPIVEPVHYSNENETLPIDPYLLGCWLGDGSSNNGQVTSMDQEIHDLFSSEYAVGRVEKQQNNRASTITYLGLRTKLRELGLLNNKHIPEMYLRSNPDARLAVIQGLMDTDGTAGDCSTEFSSSSAKLADGVVELIQSLGGIARVRTRIPTFTYLGVKKQGALSYRVNIKLPSNMIPFRLKRKVDSYVVPSKYPPARYIESIEYSHDEESQCIAVDAPDHLYVTDSYIVTHNTIQAIATLEHVFDSYPAVVVCPPSLVLNWANEYSKWLPNRRVATVTNRKEFPDSGTYDVVVVGYSNISTWEKKLAGHRSYVFDESHYAKTPTAQRTKAAVKIARSAPKEGIILCLTGTPVTNRPNEYASQLDILGRLKDFGGLWGFYRRYCAAYQDSYGQWNISGHSHLDELNDRLRGACYIRRTKDQVLSELPPVMHSKVLVAGNTAAMKEYDRAEADIILYIAQRARELAKEQGKSMHGAAIAAMIRAEANEHLVRLSVLRRLAAKAKMEVVEEWINGRIESGKKVVVAAHHRDIVDEIARKYGNLRIQGGMSVEEVEENKRRFQSESVNDAPVIVLSIQAAKTGHTLTAAEECLFVELPWTPADVDQTYSRLHRIGQKGSVTSTYLLTQGTIDEEIYGIIERKRHVVNAAVDGGEVFDDDSTVQLIMNLLNKNEAATND